MSSLRWLPLCVVTVLENFSSKSRNTVSVREGQAVVLLCGPPPHYGGTVPSPNSCIVCCTFSSLLASAFFIVPPSAAYYLPVTLPFVFPPSYLHFPSLFVPNSDSLFSTRFSLSVRQGSFFMIIPEAVASHLFFIASHCLTLSSLFPPIWSVTTLSSIKSPELHSPEHFFSTMRAGYLRVIKAAGGCGGRGELLSHGTAVSLLMCLCAAD